MSDRGTFLSRSLLLGYLQITFPVVPGFLCCLWGRLFAFCLFGGRRGGGGAVSVISISCSSPPSILIRSRCSSTKLFGTANTLWDPILQKAVPYEKLITKKKKKKNERNDYGANHSKIKNCWGKTFSEIIVLPWFLAGLWCCSIIIVSYDNKKGNKFYNNFIYCMIQ